MPTAYVLINCDLYHKRQVVKEISRLPGISESVELDAIYDILVKLNPVTVEELKETITGPLKKIRYIKSIVTLVATNVMDWMECV